MRRIKSWLAATGVLVTAAGTTGCSHFEQLFVVNRSNGPLTIVATASTWQSITTGEQLCGWSGPTHQPPPEFKGIEASRVRSDFVARDEFTKTVASTFDEPSCSVRLVIGPGLAVVVWDSSNYRRDPFLTKLVLGDPGVVVDGRDVLARFKKRSRAVYVFDYR
jgi:hypothetical protein